MFHLEVLAERLPLTSIFQNVTFIHHVQRLANVTKIAKFNLPSIIAEVDFITVRNTARTDKRIKQYFEFDAPQRSTYVVKRACKHTMIESNHKDQGSALHKARKCCVSDQLMSFRDPTRS